MTAPADELDRLFPGNSKADVEVKAALKKYIEDRIVAELEELKAKLSNDMDGYGAKIIGDRIAEIKAGK